jgi:hypothetical protein
MSNTAPSDPFRGVAMTRELIRVLAVLLIAFVGLYFNHAEFALQIVALLLGS